MTLFLYAITAVNVLVAAGFAIAGLIRPAFVAPGPQVESSRIFALYAAARTIPLAVAAVSALLFAPLVVVLWIGGLAGIVQLIDGYVGWRQRDAGKTWGPVAIGILQWMAVAAVAFTTT